MNWQEINDRAEKDEKDAVEEYLQKRKSDGTLLSNSEPQELPSLTLSQAVEQQVCRCIILGGIIGEILATIKVNIERGYIVAQGDDGKLRLAEIMASWEKQLAQLDDMYPPVQLKVMRKLASNSDRSLDNDNPR